MTKSHHLCGSSRLSAAVGILAVLIICILLEACFCLPFPGLLEETYCRILITKSESGEAEDLLLIRKLESGKAEFFAGNCYPTTEQCESAILKDFEIKYPEHQIVRAKQKYGFNSWNVFKVLNKDGMEVDSAYCADRSYCKF